MPAPKGKVTAPTRKGSVAPAKVTKKRTQQAVEEESADEALGELSLDMASSDEASSEEEEDAEADSEEEDALAGDSVDEEDSEADLETEEETEDDASDIESDGSDAVPSLMDDMGRPLPLRPEIEADYDSDSSTEMHGTNTVGNIPMEWYDDLPHIGYDLEGKKVMRQERSDELDKFLANADDPDAWRSVRDELMQQNIVLSQDELEIIKRMQSGHYTQADYDPYEPMVEFFSSKTMIHPVTNVPEPKRRFVPSKWEAKRVMKMVRAIRQGRVHSRRKAGSEEKGQFFHLWDETTDVPGRTDHVTSIIPAPKMPLPDHSESYNPPAEYLLDDEEERAWKEAEPEDRARNYVPSKFSALRQVPAYGQFIKERFERCMNLYLSPRIRKHRLNIDPESLIPKLPDPKDLEPYPSKLGLTFRGHEGKIRSFSVDASGMWMVSGADDGTVRLWSVGTGRCVRVWTFPPTKQGEGEEERPAVVGKVAWNPNREVCLFAVAVGTQVLLISPPEVADASTRLATAALLATGFSIDRSKETSAPIVSWERASEGQTDEGILLILNHPRITTGITWHRRGDYFASLCTLGESMTVLIHQVSRHQTQRPFHKTKGAVQQVLFHPSKPHFFVATQRYVRVYNLQQQALIKTLQPGVRWISSIDVHPQGDNVIVGSYDRRTCWFDLDLSSKPYKTLRYHKKAVRSVAYHQHQPLFASASDDGSLQVFHGMVYNDLMQNPLIVPVKILRGHAVRGGLGVLHCEFHPTQPWLLSSGADHTIRLWC